MYSKKVILFYYGLSPIFTTVPASKVKIPRMAGLVNRR